MALDQDITSDGSGIRYVRGDPQDVINEYDDIKPSRRVDFGTFHNGTNPKAWFVVQAN